MEILLEEYKNKPILVFKEDKRILLSFGIKKAKIIIDNIERIKEFVEKNISS